MDIDEIIKTAVLDDLRKRCSTFPRQKTYEKIHPIVIEKMIFEVTGWERRPFETIPEYISRYYSKTVNPHWKRK